jgi:DNA helicase-2/ATP-dependent DNA helicase PcrA
MITLREAYARLSPKQVEAVTGEGNTVVLAGPGSGKTDTIVLKASYLLTEVLPPTRGVAVLTYNNDTVLEVAERLRRLGHPQSRRLFCGTLHGFSLNKVIRAFKPIVQPDAPPVNVIQSGYERELWLDAFEAAKLAEDPDWTLERRIRARRAIVLGADVSYEDDRLVEAIRQFETCLAKEGLIDFEGMILQAFSLIHDHAQLRRALLSRYPWILIDEYQDLGAILHQMILEFANSGARVLAVGDPDQSIYGFTGAEPRLMHELYSSEGFDKVDLEFNYRSGRRIIYASMAALGEERSIASAPTTRDPGLVESIDIPGGIEAQAHHIAAVILPDLFQRGVGPDQIAILYSVRGQVPRAVREALDVAEIPYVSERDTRFLGGNVGRWLQRCARRAVDPDSPDAESLDDLVNDLARWQAPTASLRGVALLRALWRVVKDGGLPGARIAPWISAADLTLGISSGIHDSDGADDAEAYKALLASLADPAVGSASIHEYAEGARVLGKVVLTTYHSSKGRQFDAVILPGLQDQVMPRMHWDPSARRMSISARELQEQRRLFYVGFTRARYQVVILSSEFAANDKGFSMPRSRFVRELDARLAAGDA